VDAPWARVGPDGHRVREEFARVGRKTRRKAKAMGKRRAIDMGRRDEVAGTRGRCPSVGIARIARISQAEESDYEAEDRARIGLFHVDTHIMQR